MPVFCFTPLRPKSDRIYMRTSKLFRSLSHACLATDFITDYSNSDYLSLSSYYLEKKTTPKQKAGAAITPFSGVITTPAIWYLGSLIRIRGSVIGYIFISISLIWCRISSKEMVFVPSFPLTSISIFPSSLRMRSNTLGLILLLLRTSLMGNLFKITSPPFCCPFFCTGQLLYLW